MLSGGPVGRDTVSRRLYPRRMAPREAATVVPLRPVPDVEDATPAQPVPLAPLELPRARRPGWPTLAALAIATGLAAVGLGAWSVVTEVRSEPSAAAAAEGERALAVLADSSAERFPLRGSVGRIALVVRGDGAAVIALDGLGPAPVGRTYRVWVVREGSATPLADAAFDGTSRVVLLERLVPPGTRVAVTLEPSGDAERPSRPLRLSAVRS